MPITNLTPIIQSVNSIPTASFQDDLDERVRKQVARIIDLDFLEFLDEVVEKTPDLNAAYIAFKARKRMGVK